MVNYRKYVKRVLDFVLSLVLLVVISPLFIIIACILFFSLKGSPFFFQKRGGYLNKPFFVIKFRTMSNEVDDNGDLLPDSERLTVLGRLVRKLSLDEIPQIINVIKGDMSFIGPRPFLYEYMLVYSDEEKRRHSVRPGITGWAQVNGRNSITWKEKFKYDLYYVDNVSFFLDVKIVLLTIKKIILRESVDQGAGVTMEKYNGKN